MRIILVGPIRLNWEAETSAVSPGTSGTLRTLFETLDMKSRFSRSADTSVSSKTVNQIRIIGPRGLDWLAEILRARRQLASSNALVSRKVRRYAVYTGSRLQTLLCATSYDVIHVHAVNHGRRFGLGATEHDYKVVTTVHSYSGLVFADESDLAGQRTLYDKALGASSAVIHVSKADREKGERLGVRHNTQEFVIPNGLPIFDRRPGNEDRLGVCFAGALTKAKGLPMLLAAWQLRSSPESRLRVDGRGPLLRRIEAAARHDRSKPHCIVIRSTV